MKAVHLGMTAALLAALAVPAAGSTLIDLDGVSGGGSSALPPYLQCVPYAREVSGIRIFGDAHTWWDQAEGRYARGYRPKVGAVMAFKAHGSSRLGHVAAVSRIVDSRTVLVRHSNWSPINGRRGQIEDNVRVVDVSEDNDWSAVRVWYAPIQDLGTTHWPLAGFIYPDRSKADSPTLARKGADSKGREARPASRQPALAAAMDDDPIGEIIAARLAARR